MGPRPRIEKVQDNPGLPLYKEPKEVLRNRVGVPPGCWKQLAGVPLTKTGISDWSININKDSTIISIVWGESLSSY